MASSVPGKVFHCSHSLNGAHQRFPENTCGLFPRGGSSQLQALRYCYFGILLAFAVAHTGGTCPDRTDILWCMSRGNANESPTGHLISRCGPHASLPFPQETRPQALGSLHHHLKGGSRAGTQGIPPEQHLLPTSKGSHILQLPWSWDQKGLVGCPLSFMSSIWGSSLPGAVGGMTSRSSLVLW